MNIIKVAVAGCRGRMGAAVCEMIRSSEDMRLCVLYDKNSAGEEEHGLKICAGITDENINGRAEAMIDFTHPECVYDNAVCSLENGVNCIIGTTGLTSRQRSELEKLTVEKNLFTLIAPNFAIGAVLMMKFSAAASKYMDRAEIIEMHHERKVDAPSGTALLTAEAIETNCAVADAGEKVTLEGARGGAAGGVRIHSIRLPGFLAHQQVIFGSAGQTLTIRHDSISRESFMPGIALAVRKSQKLRGFYYGLETIMDFRF